MWVHRTLASVAGFPWEILKELFSLGGNSRWDNGSMPIQWNLWETTPYLAPLFS